MLPSTSIPGIHGQMLEVTVVGCCKLKDTEWISRQDPYVLVEYGKTKFKTRTCTDGGKNPIFQEKFIFTLIEGIQELKVVVWNSNTLTYDDFIGSGKIQLQKVLYQGYDDTAWPLQSKNGRYSGEVRLVLHYANAANKMASNIPPSAPPYLTPHSQMYPTPPPGAYHPASGYPYPPYIPNPAAYPTAQYPPQPYPPAYPPESYYPPSYYPPPPGPYMGHYPSPPY